MYQTAQWNQLAAPRGGIAGLWGEHEQLSRFYGCTANGMHVKASSNIVRHCRLRGATNSSAAFVGCIATSCIIESTSSPRGGIAGPGRTQQLSHLRIAKR